MRHIVFDLETTGFRFDEGHRIVEIGGVEMVGGAVTGKSFHAYVNPERDMPIGAYNVHGLSEAFLRDKPLFADPAVGPGFVEFVGDATLIAHNGVAFDLPFLNAELAAAGLAPLKNDIIDTMLIARKKYPGSPASLDALCSRFGIDLGERQAEGHGALLDSKLLATVYIELTGGVQAGLDLLGAKDRDRNAPRAKAPPRARPVGSLLTEEERAAHDAFIAEMGDKAIWRQIT